MHQVEMVDVLMPKAERFFTLFFTAFFSAWCFVFVCVWGGGAVYLFFLFPVFGPHYHEQVNFFPLFSQVGQEKEKRLKNKNDSTRRAPTLIPQDGGSNHNAQKHL